MSDVMELRTNIWEEAALKFPTGKLIDTKRGPRVLFTVIDAEGQERALFLSPAEGAKVDELRLGPGERFNLAKLEVKTGNRRYLDFAVQRVDPPAATQVQLPTATAPRPEPPAPPPAKVSGAAVPVRSAGGDPGNGQSSTPPKPANGNGHAAANGAPCWDPKAELLRCYDEAIDVLVMARDRAAGNGLPVQFTGEDLRQVAATLYIDAGKDRRTPWQR